MRYQRHLSLIVSFDHDFFSSCELKARSANLIICSSNVLNLLLGCEHDICWALVWWGGLQSSAPSDSWVWCRRNLGQLIVPCGCEILLFSLTCCRLSPHYSGLILVFLRCVVLQCSPRFSVSLDNYCSQISD